jgi:hypothetical protein
LQSAGLKGLNHEGHKGTRRKEHGFSLVRHGPSVTFNAV